ncbi:hypothetical protein ACQEU6_39530 [Spirillospora sp. CA-108201]
MDKPFCSRIGTQALVETDVNFAIGLAQIVQVDLGSKCPNGAEGACLLEQLLG